MQRITHGLLVNKHSENELGRKKEFELKTSISQVHRPLAKTREITLPQNETATDALTKFYPTGSKDQQILAFVGGGTAALAYLYTADLAPQYTHVVILGNRGYWNCAAHRLAQPHHIFALPHRPSDAFIDSAAHDQSKGILPHQSESAYVHSDDYQTRVTELEKATCAALNKKGINVFIVRNAWVREIVKVKSFHFKIQINHAALPVFANKVICATGAGPERKLEPHLQSLLFASVGDDAKAITEIKDRILTYTNILSPVVEKCREKDVLIYGGGATAAWAMEVAALIAKPIAWVGRSGFGNAEIAGPRVGAIIESSRSVQVHGKIHDISYVTDKVTSEKRFLIKIIMADFGKPTQTFLVDYVFNCIGQDPYEANGLPEIISPAIRNELIPHLDKNRVTGTEQPCMLGWISRESDFLIMGAAQGTYYDKCRLFTRPSSISSFLPKSGQLVTTIGGVIAEVCATTNYMPIVQDPKTGKITSTSLNIHVMNATQLAVYFTGLYPEATAAQVNNAVKAYLPLRAKTEFGLSPEQLSEFMHTHFEKLSIESPLRARASSLPKKYAPRLFDADRSDNEANAASQHFLAFRPAYQS